MFPLPLLYTAGFSRIGAREGGKKKPPGGTAEVCAGYSPPGGIPPPGEGAPGWGSPTPSFDKPFTWAAHPNPGGHLSGGEGGQLRETPHPPTLNRFFPPLEGGAAAARAPWVAGPWGAHIDSWGARARVQLGGAAGSPASSGVSGMDFRWWPLVPISHWSTPEAGELARQVVAAGGLLGGVLVPPCRDASTYFSRPRLGGSAQPWRTPLTSMWHRPAH
jgi:hypothetical protein